MWEVVRAALKVFKAAPAPGVETPGYPDEAPSGLIAMENGFDGGQRPLPNTAIGIPR
jgi:hypothetical protein